MSNRLDPDQDRCSVGADLGPNCLHLRLSADDKERLLAIFNRFIKSLFNTNVYIVHLNSIFIMYLQINN